VQRSNAPASARCIYAEKHTWQPAAGQGSAAAEFQKILDHLGIVWNCWTGALAHLGVARANALLARTAHGADAARVRALAAYRDFLTLWKDADPDIPILKEAEAQYAKLPTPWRSLTFPSSPPNMCTQCPRPPNPGGRQFPITASSARSAAAGWVSSSEPKT
jgi:hypothetical protein